MSIYKATIKNYSNHTIQLAVESSEVDYRYDLRTAACQETGLPVGAIRLHNVAQSSRNEIAGWEPIKQCRQAGEVWGWVSY
jgi:hypothetical protein